MPKKKMLLRYKIAHWFISHPWIKLVSLVLAILLWLYVKGEIEKFN